MPREPFSLATECISEKCTRRAEVAFDPPASRLSREAVRACSGGRRGVGMCHHAARSPQPWQGPCGGWLALPSFRERGLRLHGWHSRPEKRLFWLFLSPRPQRIAAVSARRNAQHFRGQLPVQSCTPEGHALGLSTSTKEMQ